MLGDAFEHMPQIQVRVDVIETRGGDQRVDVGRPLAAGVGAGEQIVASPEDQRPNRALGGVVDLDAAIVAIAGQRHPAHQRVLDRPGEFGLGRDQAQRRGQPILQRVQQRPRVLLPHLSSFRWLATADLAFNHIEFTNAPDGLGR